MSSSPIYIRLSLEVRCIHIICTVLYNSLIYIDCILLQGVKMPRKNEGAQASETKIISHLGGLGTCSPR